jgi:colanic acid biosynthesis glycosyl transferase WcaI
VIRQPDPLRIHVLGINYWPEKTGIAVFNTGRAEYLASCGHHVTMCTAVPYYPEWKIAGEYRHHLLAREQRHGVDIRRCPLYVPSRVTPLRRVAHEASFVAAALLRSLFCRRPDVLFVVSPPLGLAAAAVVLAWLWRVPYVFHVEDLQPDAALDLGMLRPGRLTRFLYAVERLAYRKAALVSTITTPMRDRIVAKGVPPARVAQFSAWADPELFALSTGRDDAALRAELGIGHGTVVLHAGNMGVKQGLDVIVAAAERTRSVTDLTYVLVGDGATRPALEARVRASGLANVRIIPLLDNDRFLRVLALADICLVTQQRSVADIVFPSKVVTLLAAGKPILASVTAGSEVARVISTSGGGEVVEPEDPDALVSAMMSLRDDGRRRARMAADGRAFAATRWDRTVTLAYLEQMVRAVANRHDVDAAALRSAPAVLPRTAIDEVRESAERR